MLSMCPLLEFHIRHGFSLLLHRSAVLVFRLSPVAVAPVHSKVIVPDASNVMHYLILLQCQASHG